VPGVVLDMDIPIGSAFGLLLVSAMCGLIGQLVRMSIGILKDYTNCLKHKNDGLEERLNGRLKQIRDELKSAEPGKVAALMREKRYTEGICRRHAAIYDSWSKSFFDLERLGVSLAISIFVGTFAGIFYLFSGLVNGADIFTEFNVLSSLVAGYVGTDVIEGFMTKNKIEIPTSIEKPEEGG